MKVVCNKAGKYEICAECKHYIAHEPIAEITCFSDGDCRRWGRCSKIKNDVGVRCVKVKTIAKAKGEK